MRDLGLGIAMKEGMRRLAAGVCVLSTKDKGGLRYAMTASSVTSVSDTPASLLVCVNRETSMFQALEEGGAFCVNVLSYRQQDVSNRCASGDQGESRFEEGAWLTHEPTGLPFLRGSQAVFTCEQDRSFLYGTHKIVIGRITSVLVEEGPVAPLIYVNGGYHSI